MQRGLTSDRPLTPSLEEFPKVAIVVGALALVLLLWKLEEALAPLFAVTIFAVALRSLVQRLEPFSPLPSPCRIITAAVLLNS